MLKAVFYRKRGGANGGNTEGSAFSGFSVTGHADYGDEGSDVVCAAVSSAVMLVCNAATDFYRAAAEVNVDENCITLTLTEENNSVQPLLEAFYDHMNAIADEYRRVKVEVKFTGGKNDD